MRKKGEAEVRVNTSAKISSPDQLTDYLRVTNPGVWVLLASVVLLLAGLFAWASIGTLETVIDVNTTIARACPILKANVRAAKNIPLRSSPVSRRLNSATSATQA